MYCVVRDSAFCAALALVVCGGSPALAQVPLLGPLLPEAEADSTAAAADDDREAGKAPAAKPAGPLLFDDPLFGGVMPERFLFFSGFDLWRGGGSVHGGLLFAPWGLQRDGFVAKLLIGAGSYRYASNNRFIRGTHTFASVMPGYRLSGNGYEARLFAGLDVQTHMLAPLDPANPLQGFHLGARLNGEFWWEPFHATMLAASFSVSSIGPNYSLRGAAGWKLFDSFYLGPEIETFSDFRYRQYRIGAHVTALRSGDVEWTAGFGYALDSSDASGIYGRLGLLVRR